MLCLKKRIRNDSIFTSPITSGPSYFSKKNTFSANAMASSSAFVVLFPSRSTKHRGCLPSPEKVGLKKKSSLENFFFWRPTAGSHSFFLVLNPKWLKFSYLLVCLTCSFGQFVLEKLNSSF